MSQIQSSFGPIQFYDAPEVALTQVLDDEATFGSFVDTFFSPDDLSPQQRDTFTDRMRQDLGIPEKGPGSALLNIATNPLTYLAFLFAPAALASKTGRIFSQSVKNNLTMLWARNGNEMMMGTPGSAAVNRLSQGGRELAKESESIIGPAELKYAESMGIERSQYLDPTRIKDKALRAQVEQDKRLILYRNMGLHRAEDITETNYFYQFDEVQNVSDVGTRTLRQVDVRVTDEQRIRELMTEYRDKKVASDSFISKDGKIYKVDTSIENATFLDTVSKQDRLIQADLEKTLADRGLLDLADSYQDMFRQRMARNFLKDGTTISDVRAVEKIIDPEAKAKRTAELLDVNKVLRLKTSLRNGKYTDEQLGLPGFFDRILGPEMQMQFMTKNPKIGNDKFIDLVTKGMTNELFSRGVYFPRNQIEFYTHVRKPGGLKAFQRVEGLDRPTFDSQGKIQFRETMGQLTATGRAQTREAALPSFHGDDLDQMLMDVQSIGGNVNNKKFADFKARYEKAVRGADAPDGRIIPVRRMNLSGSISAYEAQTMRDYMLFVDKLTDAELIAQRDALFDTAGNVRYTERATDALRSEFMEEAKPPSLFQMMDGSAGKGEVPAGGWNRAHLLEQTSRMLQTTATDTAKVAPELGTLRGEKAAELLQEVILPAALGLRQDQRSLTRGLITQAQAVAEKFAHSKLGKQMGDVHPALANGMEQLRYFSGRDAKELMDPILHKTAGYLYSSHLGLNMASVMLNLMQPFLHLHNIVGTRATLGGMKDAVGELTNYARARAKMPINISAVERKDLLDNVLKFPDETGLMGDVISDLDRLMDTARAKSGKNFDIEKFLIEYPLKLFEKTEWMNRLTTVHAVKRNYIQRGLAQLDEAGSVRFADDAAEANFREDARTAVTQFQFGADITGTPLAFMPGTARVLPNVPEFVSNPLFRQFQQFGLRSLTSLFIGGRMVNNGQRFIRGTDIGVPYVVGDTLRMLGTSAILYEGFKGAIGADISRGGTIETLSAFADPEKLMSGEFPFVVPPVVGISGDVVRGLLGGEAQLIGDAVARALPGGIAIQRALQVAPNANENFLTSIAAPAQKFYADYEKPNPDGLVPIFKSDGTLVDYQSPTALVSRALGLNLSMPQISRDLDGYMVRLRDNINKNRREWLDEAIRKSDLPAAERLNAKFQKQYGFRIPITKQQVTAYIKSMETPRSLRMMDRMPQEVRSYFQQEMARNPDRVGTTERALLEIPTTASRQEAYGGNLPVELSPEVIAQIKRAMQQTEAQREALTPQVFESFGGF